jgi:hypothetical protein
MRSRWSVLSPILCGVVVLSGCARSGRPSPADEARAVAKPSADDSSSKPQPSAQDGQPNGTKQEGSAEFRFPEDAGGALLAKRLRPDRPPEPERTTQPRRRAAPRSLEDPQPPLPPAVVSESRLKLESVALRLQPSLTLEETLDDVAEAQLLHCAALPEGERVRTPSEDVKVPPPLPRLATPLPDRASLEDPTQDVSSAAVVAAPPPVRKLPVPFQRVNLPDPFENRTAIRPPPLGEEEVPGTPRP